MFGQPLSEADMRKLLIILGMLLIPFISLADTESVQGLSQPGAMQGSAWFTGTQKVGGVQGVTAAPQASYARYRYIRCDVTTTWTVNLFSSDWYGIAEVELYKDGDTSTDLCVTNDSCTATGSNSTATPEKAIDNLHSRSNTPYEFWQYMVATTGASPYWQYDLGSDQGISRIKFSPFNMATYGSQVKDYTWKGATSAEPTTWVTLGSGQYENYTDDTTRWITIDLDPEE